MILIALPVLAMLSDTPPSDAAGVYDHARLNSLQGHIEDAQREAAQGYIQSLASQPVYARKLQLLEASMELKRGLNVDALVLLADDQIPWSAPDDVIQRFALEAFAMTTLHRLPEAEAKLSAADSLCNTTPSSSCGTVLQGHGLLLQARGRIASSEAVFLKSLDFARAHANVQLEINSLLNLGHAASLQEHHDVAVNYYRLAGQKALEIGGLDLQQQALGNQGWEQFSEGNAEKALETFREAEARAASIGNLSFEAQWLSTSALAYAETRQFPLAEQAELRTLEIARKIDRKQTISDALMDLAQLYVRLDRPDDADRYVSQARAMATETGSPVDLLNCDLIAGWAASLRHDYQRANLLLLRVANGPDSQTSMKWEAQQALGNLYESQGDPAAAEHAFQAALALVEGARADLKQEVFRLTFLENASSIYDDYIHLLVSEGKTQEALEAADWSRARTLQQGLGSIVPSTANVGAKLRNASSEFTATPKLNAAGIARRTNSTLLFYGLGEKQSYLWVISPEETRLVTLPPRSAILPTMERYRKAILGLKDPLRDGAGEVAADGTWLYRTLIAPAAGQLRPDRQVVLFVDGEMGQVNFETLLVPSPSPHFWIEDATVLQSPSIRMFAQTLHDTPRKRDAADTMLLAGDTILPAGAEFQPLPMAAREMETVRGYFPQTAKVLQGAKATPVAYLTSDPGRFEYIHFVAHGTASRTDPLESAVVLSQGGSGEEGYKLYARDIVRHPIDARLVTISACNSSGSKSFAGEGLVGLSWAFLRAGAHNAIGSLWEVSDASTPELMNTLYSELRRGASPASALRTAKLSLLRSGGHLVRPFYWAPFQLYAGR